MCSGLGTLLNLLKAAESKRCHLKASLHQMTGLKAACLLCSGHTPNYYFFFGAWAHSAWIIGQDLWKILIKAEKPIKTDRHKEGELFEPSWLFLLIMWHHKCSPCLHWAHPKPSYWWVITAVPPWPFLFFKARQQPKTKITYHEYPTTLQSTFCTNDMKWISVKACSRRRRETLGPCESPVLKSTRSKRGIDVEYFMRAIADFQAANRWSVFQLHSRLYWVLPLLDFAQK